MTTGRVYSLSDPRNELIRYIGATRRSLAERLSGHISSPNSARMSAWFQDMAQVGAHPRIEAVAEVPLSQLRAEEIGQTRAHLRDGWPLLNVEDLPGHLWWADIDMCYRRIERCAQYGGALVSEARDLLARAQQFRATADDLRRMVRPTTVGELDVAVRLQLADRRARGVRGCSSSDAHEDAIVAAMIDIATTASAHGVAYARSLDVMLSAVVDGTRPGAVDAVSAAIGAGA